MSSFCYWCKSKLANRSFRRYVEYKLGRQVYGHFCDEVCVQCWEIDRGFAKQSQARVIIEDEYVKRGRCEYCKTESESSSFDYCLTEKCREDNSGDRVSYYCNARCFEKAYWEM